MAAASATPASGTVRRQEGDKLVLSHPRFAWSLALPRDWQVVLDSGFQLWAANPARTGFVRLVSQMWPTPEERLANARAYVNYWKKFQYGDMFPVYAGGQQLSEAEVAKDKPGGPYLRYEFDDQGKGKHYLEVYASGGGPNSLIVSVWAKSADFDGQKAALEGILDSAALVTKP